MANDAAAGHERLSGRRRQQVDLEFHAQDVLACRAERQRRITASAVDGAGEAITALRQRLMRRLGWSAGR